jgi:hypothetical protein
VSAGNLYKIVQFYLKMMCPEKTPRAQIKEPLERDFFMRPVFSHKFDTRNFCEVQQKVGIWLSASYFKLPFEQSVVTSLNHKSVLELFPRGGSFKEI